MPKSKSRKEKSPKRVLALPDLEQAKTAVLNSLTSASGQWQRREAPASRSLHRTTSVARVRGSATWLAAN